MDEIITGQLEDLKKLLCEVAQASVKISRDSALLGIKYIFKKVIFRKSMNAEISTHLNNLDQYIQKGKSILIHIHGISGILGVDDSAYVERLKVYSNSVGDSLAKLEHAKSKLKGLID